MLFWILLIINLYILMNTGVSSGARAVAPAAAAPAPKGWTVLGSMGCGWTRKQLDYLKAKGIPHTFKDCAGGKCAGVDAFPTLISPNGEKIVGYSEV